MKKWFVSQLKSGQAVTELFVLAEKALSHKKDGAPYLSIALSDKTGRVRGVVWDNVEQIADAAAAASAICSTLSHTTPRTRPVLSDNAMLRYGAPSFL